MCSVYTSNNLHTHQYISSINLPRSTCIGVLPTNILHSVYIWMYSQYKSPPWMCLNVHLLLSTHINMFLYIFSTLHTHPCVSSINFPLWIRINAFPTYILYSAYISGRFLHKFPTPHTQQCVSFKHTFHVAMHWHFGKSNNNSSPIINGSDWLHNPCSMPLPIYT